METVDKTLTISEQLSEFIDLSDAELKRVTGGWGHGNGGHNSCDWGDHGGHGGHNSCDWGGHGGHNSCDWGGNGGHNSCDWSGHGGHNSCWG